MISAEATLGFQTFNQETAIELLAIDQMTLNGHAKALMGLLSGLAPSAKLGHNAPSVAPLTPLTKPF